VVSRIVHKEMRLGPDERAFFVKVARAYADLLGVKLITWCVMGNHFHLLVRVPRRPDADRVEGGGPSLETVIERLAAAVGEMQMRLIRRQLAQWRRAGADEAIEAWRRRQVAAMYSLSEYMKRVKQRFTRWYNKRTGLNGVLWEDRYRSTIVQDGAAAASGQERRFSGERRVRRAGGGGAAAAARRGLRPRDLPDHDRILRLMAAYIDLNPVRAGFCKDPGDYPWSAYGAAMQGDAGARRALAGMLDRDNAGAATDEGRALREEWRALARYREWLGVGARAKRSAAVSSGLLASQPALVRGVALGTREWLADSTGTLQPVPTRSAMHRFAGCLGPMCSLRKPRLRAPAAADPDVPDGGT
jgi:hypothetical protein